MTFSDEPMLGVRFYALDRWEDQRGWLVELWRSDELPEGFDATMGYLSCTEPGISRGPHEHKDQTDGFIFLDGEYDLCLWENRGEEPGEMHVFRVGSDRRVFVTVPPGVVHGYKNVGQRAALVLNFPDRLYAGVGKKEPVDEIRHENNPDSPFRMP